MKNLAGVKTCDEDILTELSIADIPIEHVGHSNGEVPYTIIGRIGNWTFKRAWYYWVVSVENEIDGLPLKVAMKLHNKPNPAGGIMGDTVRCGGYAGGISPDEYGAYPIYDDNLNNLLVELGYELKYYPQLDKHFVSINNGQISELCKSGKLKVEQYVKTYHVDDMIGLKEIATTLKKFVNNEPEPDFKMLNSFLKFIVERHTDEYGNLQLVENGDELDPTYERAINQFLSEQ